MYKTSNIQVGKPVSYNSASLKYVGFQPTARRTFHELPILVDQLNKSTHYYRANYGKSRLTR